MGLGCYKGKAPRALTNSAATSANWRGARMLSSSLAALPWPLRLCRDGPAAGHNSEHLAALAAYIETCIEAFGANRAMFESNYPVDYWGASYAVLWNAHKRLARSASADEEAALFAGTAARSTGSKTC